MSVGYLTDFAKTLDIFFNGLSDCGVLTKYSVQLQAALVDLNLILKFRNLICQLVKSLQELLNKISKGSSESAVCTNEDGTSKTKDLLVGCDPTTLKRLDAPDEKHQILSAVPNNHVLGDKANALISAEHKCIEKQSSTEEPNKAVVRRTARKPLLVTNDKAVDETTVKGKDSNLVQIVVEAVDNMTDEVIETVSELTCEECDRHFKSSGTLEKHLQSHSGFCNMCNQVFNCVQTLQDHCRTEHEGAGCFMCSTCGKRFMTKFSYSRHMESHRGEKGAVCHVCGKSFSRADYLQTHYTIHVGKRSFACSQCPKKFVRRIQLISHEKTHSGIKDHICKMCNRGFARSDKLREHMLRHLNIKRYQCATCKRFYAEKRDLKTHLKVHMSF